MVKPTKEQILKEVEKMHRWQRKNYDKDKITSRIVYAMSEVMRWCVEDTNWESPFEQAKDNAKILKQELKSEVGK